MSNARELSEIASAIVIDGSKNVGIGTTSPSQKLEVVGNIMGTQSITIGSNGLYQAGSIYSDANWGMLFRAKQASPVQAEFRWSNAGDTERMRIDSSGNVGIGTNSPEARLNIAGALGGIIGSGASTIRLTNTDAGNYASISAGIVGTTNAGMDFSIDGTRAMVIASTGNIGIGTNTPGGARLAVVAPSGTYTSFTGKPYTEVSSDVIISRTSSSTAVVQAPNLYFDDGTTNNTRAIQCGSGNLQFWAYRSGWVEDMRISHTNGNVLIGLTTSSGSRLQVQRNNPSAYHDSHLELISAAGDVVLSFHAAGSSAVCFEHVRGAAGFRCVNLTRNAFVPIEASAFPIGSDYRLKENIVTLTGALDRLAKLPVHRFNFRSAEEVGMDYGDKTVDGFLAHEVAEVVPEAAFGEKDAIKEDGTPAYQSVDLSKLVPLLAAAIQEQQVMIEELKAKVAALEAA